MNKRKFIDILIMNTTTIFIVCIFILQANTANALLITHSTVGPTIQTHRNETTGVVISEQITHPGYSTSRIEWTPSQKDDLTEIIKLVISVVSLFDPSVRIAGEFVTFSDASGDFNINTTHLPDGTSILELNPTNKIGPIGGYGLLELTFNTDPIDFGKAGYISYTAIGITGEETVLDPIQPIPEPSTLMLITIGFFTIARYSITRNKNCNYT